MRVLRTDILVMHDANHAVTVGQGEQPVGRRVPDELVILAHIDIVEAPPLPQAAQIAERGSRYPEISSVWIAVEPGLAALQIKSNERIDATKLRLMFEQAFHHITNSIRGL